MQKEKKDLSKYIKMKELKEKTGLPSSTINYYLRNNLLPEPVKTGKNMAWYHPSTISRINLIKKLKEKNRLTISEIEEIVNGSERPDDLYVMETMHEFVFGEISDRLYEKEELAELAGIESSDLDNLLKSKIIVPAANEMFDDSDLFAAKSFKRLKEFGFQVEDIKYYAEAAEIVARNEMKLRKKVTQHIPPEKNAEITYELTDIARKFRSYIFERAFQTKVLGRKRKKGVIDEDSGS